MSADTAATAATAGLDVGDDPEFKHNYDFIVNFWKSKAHFETKKGLRLRWRFDTRILLVDFLEEVVDTFGASEFPDATKLTVGWNEARAALSPTQAQDRYTTMLEEVSRYIYMPLIIKFPLERMH